MSLNKSKFYKKTENRKQKVITARLLFIAVIFLMISGCRPDENLKQDKPPSKEEEKITILGDKLKNPYTVRNMKAAYKNLKTGHAGGRPSPVMEEEFSIRPTHYYVRLLPENWPAYDSLKTDTSLFLHDRPIDVKAVKEADYYHDPSVPKDKPTWQYTSVPLSYKVPFGNKMEIIDTLYLAEEVEKKGGKISQARQLAMDVLENEALLLTDNLTEEEKKLRERKAGPGARIPWFWNNWFSIPDLWTPSGSVHVFDDVNGGSQQPVVGARVECYRWFRTHVGIADHNGNYSCNGTFRYKAEYQISWERGNYSIRSDGFGQAELDGPTQRGRWAVSIGGNTLQQSYAFAHLGAHQYYYGERLGLKTPPEDTFWRPQMKIGVYDKSGRAIQNKNWRLFGIFTQIEIYRYNERGWPIPSLDKFAIMVHELAHASHWELRKGAWTATDDKLIESWAIGVSWSLTRLRYPTYTTNQDMPFRAVTDPESKYTSLIIDLMDNTNQGVGNTNRALDRVTGYSISQIEEALKGCASIMDLRNRLRDLYDNPTEQFLDELFDQYNRLSR